MIFTKLLMINCFDGVSCVCGRELRPCLESVSLYCPCIKNMICDLKI